MTRTRTAAVTLAVLLTLPACSSDTKPVAAPTSAAAASSAAPSPTPSVDDRAGCRAVADAGAFDTDPTTNRAAGQLAVAASVPGISSAGRHLIAAADNAAANPGVDANLDLAKAQLDVAEACAAAFGDGPW